MNHFAANLRKLRLDRGMTQEQTAAKLGVSPQSVSRWETSATYPDVLLLPEIARLYGVLVDELFKPSAKGYDNNALRLLAVFEHTHKPEDFLAAAQEFEKIIRAGAATADDWRSYGVTHEYMVYQCIEKATQSYEKAMAMTRETDAEMYHRTRRQSDLLRSRIGQSEACIAEQEETVRRNPDSADAWADLAHALGCANQPERTLQVCEEALERFPDNALLHIFAGDACRTLRRYDQAFPHWEEALRLNDTFTDAMFSMAFCRGDMGSSTRRPSCGRRSQGSWTSAGWRSRPSGRGKWRRNAGSKSNKREPVPRLWGAGSLALI
ncbi:MAG: helix-turn-helix domain-containing protein [Clostridiales bacterium]|nr:helix-turn-helix domain-containing protein [Clostridiales bacterium]